MVDKAPEDLNLLSGVGENFPGYPANELTGKLGKFVLIVETGAIVLLLTTGETLVGFGIEAAWHSESLLRDQFRRLMEQAAPLRNAVNAADGTTLLVTLIAFGVLLMLAGAATSLIAYKWRLDANVLQQGQRLEVLRLQVGLKEAEIGAALEASKVTIYQANPLDHSAAPNGPHKD